MKRFFLLLNLLIIFVIIYQIYNTTKCIDTKIRIHNLTKETKNICDYNTKIYNLFYAYDTGKIDNFYNIILFDKNIGKKIISKEWIDNLSLNDKNILYFILKKHYSYKNEDLINLLGTIKIKYNNFGLNIEQLLLAENILVREYDGYTDTLEGKKYVKSTLAHNELLYLEFLFNNEPELYTSINLVTDLEGAYKSIKSKKDKILFVKIMEKLNIIIPDIIIERFLSSIK